MWRMTSACRGVENSNCPAWSLQLKRVVAWNGESPAGVCCKWRFGSWMRRSVRRSEGSDAARFLRRRGRLPAGLRRAIIPRQAAQLQGKDGGKWLSSAPAWLAIGRLNRDATERAQAKGPRALSGRGASRTLPSGVYTSEGWVWSVPECGSAARPRRLLQLML